MNTICKKCNGTGWQIVQQAGQEGAVRCDCIEKHVKKDISLSAKIPKRYQHCKLDDSFQLITPSLKEAFQEALSFAKKYPKVKAGILFVGPPGVGKTHLAVGIINYLMKEKSVSCLFYDFRDLIKEIRDTYSDDSLRSEKDVLDPVLRKDVLVLDELGSQNMSDFVRDMLMYVINQRYNDNLLTIFTSNYLDTSMFQGKEKPTLDGKRKMTPSLDSKVSEPTLADRIGLRLRSRINEMCKVVKVEGGDYREIKQAGY